MREKRIAGFVSRNHTLGFVWILARVRSVRNAKGHACGCASVMFPYHGRPKLNDSAKKVTYPMVSKTGYGGCCTAYTGAY